jgi:hypothetical protein
MLKKDKINQQPRPEGRGMLVPIGMDCIAGLIPT